MPADARACSDRDPARDVARGGACSKPYRPARPATFHHTRDAIEAHLTIVFIALALAREVQSRTGLAIRNVTRQLRPLRSATIAINGTQQTFAPAIADEKQAIIDAIQGDEVTH